MHTNTSDPAGPTPCSTSAAALGEYGIDDGSDLVRRTYYDLVEDGFGEYEPTRAYVERVAATFRTTVAERAAVGRVPDPVSAAIDDAVHVTLRRADDDADLRTGVLPTFYRAFAGYHCAYRGRPLGDDGGRPGPNA